ncbi:TnsA endonuclease N-terminal domain-containing protein [Clostridium estertheticum]|uniref:TnsA endonuclease N-terminal domain-containing protein n=1 Tax=Clostridium estertheticum TaxID=238834 RepID=UPI001C7D5194|nr:TnsA endonuclease N-terminal domain-containing protein [Clostridium estertheticum]MBX4263778.1 TnsA endonuclease N-terminal domain-containing protein [Clostridium estertheticum]WLC87592.1 TnsA endonuclease N-terminal domain-containing protein [Clostridium estertheticum]
MAKRKRNSDIDKMIKEGRGSGKGDRYKPWIKIQDVPSLGRSSRIRGIKTRRQHELLSDMERNYFYFLEYSDKVQDIREQFPLLPIEDTMLIAKELGIEHPKNPETGEFIVMTTDFLVSINFNNKFYEVARTIKSKDELMNKRILEKFEIERKYWERKGINWGIVTDEEIDKVIANNISLVHGYKDIGTIDSFNDIEASELKDLIYEFIKRIIDNPKTMRTICNEFDSDMCLEKGSSLCIFKYLVINKMIDIDISEKINVNKNIPSINIMEKSIKKVEAI